MNGENKLSNIDSLAFYLLECVHEGEMDEHYLPIYEAQTNKEDEDYVFIVKKLYEWANETLQKGEQMKVTAMVHSKEQREEVEMIEKLGNNNYLVKTNDGVVCTAIFNPFVGIYYADDLYGIIRKENA